MTNPFLLCVFLSSCFVEASFIAFVFLYLQQTSSLAFLSLRLLFNLIRQDNSGKWIKQHICYTFLTLGASPSLTTKIKAQGKDFYDCKINRTFVNYDYWVTYFLIFILTHVDEEAWVPFNVGSFSFEKLKLFSSFGDMPKAFEYQHLCSLAISLHIKSKPELWFFFPTSIVVNIYHKL